MGFRFQRCTSIGLCAIFGAVLVLAAASARGEDVSSKSAGGPDVIDVPKSSATSPRPLTTAEKQKAKAEAVDAATKTDKEKPLIGDFPIPPRWYKQPRPEHSRGSTTTPADPPPK